MFCQLFPLSPSHQFQNKVKKPFNVVVTNSNRNIKRPFVAFATVLVVYMLDAPVSAIGRSPPLNARWIFPPLNNNAAATLPSPPPPSPRPPCTPSPGPGTPSPPATLICPALVYPPWLVALHPLLGFPLLSTFSGLAHVVVWCVLLFYGLILE